MTDPQGQVSSILDASAIIAWRAGEPGAELVREAIVAGAEVSAVNVAEVLAKVSDRGEDVQRARADIADVAWIVPFDAEHAFESAAIRGFTQPYNVSLGDRACLALGRLHGLPVLTADCRWAEIPRLRVKVRCIR